MENVARSTHGNLHHLLFIASLYSPCASNLNIFDGTLCETISHKKQTWEHIFLFLFLLSGSFAEREQHYNV